jgi:hypothetical protein
MKKDIIIIFFTFLSLAFVIFVFRFFFRAGADWSEYILEWASRKKPTARLLREMEKKPRERLVQIALALALAPYNWPNRRSGDDEGIVRTSGRYLDSLATLSDADLQEWIREKIQDTHSLLLKVALESLDGEEPSGRVERS